MAGVGYWGKRSRVWFGRGRQNWGAFSNDNLAISDNSAAYDHITIQYSLGKFKYRYFYGFLETLSDNTLRYISGKGIELNNKTNLIIGLHEVVVFSGVNRPLDVAYLNPISSHLDIDLNNRSNSGNDTNDQNAIWQFSIDWMLLPKLRFSSNYLIDELVIDNFEREAGKAHGLASQLRIAWSNVFRGNMCTLLIEYNRVGVYTFRHGKGGNNFVSRGYPLGTMLGSDGDVAKCGVRILSKHRLISNFYLGTMRSGEQSIVSDPYAKYDTIFVSRFPSGTVKKLSFFEAVISWYPKTNISVRLMTNVVNNNHESSSVSLGFDYFLPKSLSVKG